MPSDQPPRQHASTGPTAPQPPEPSHAERVRTLISRTATATLCTLSRKHPGFPFGSLMPFALDPAGRPLFLISNMAMHTQNLRADSHASLFIAQSLGSDDDPLGSARATLVGPATPIPAGSPDHPAAREAYLAAHESSKYWVDFADFSFFRLDPIDLYYVGGFGVMGWVSAADYAAAQPDSLAASAPAILQHMNADHVDSMILLAQTRSTLTATAAAMTSVDRLGFTLRLTTPEGIKGTRINFPSEVRTPTETREALVAMVRQAKSTR